MPTTDVAPLMATVPVTLRVAGSMVTMDLPSTRPMIAPACAVFTARSDAASAPVKAIVFRCMEISRSHERQTGMLPPPALTPRCTGTTADGCSLAAVAGHVLVREEAPWPMMDGFAGSL